MIGDPRDVGERTLQRARTTVADWVERIRGQLERFVDFDGSPTGARDRSNNLDWTGAAVGRSSSCATSASTSRSTSCSAGRRCSARLGRERHVLHRVQLPAPAEPGLPRSCSAGTAAGCRSAARTSGATSSAGVELIRRVEGAHGARADRAAGHRLRGPQVRQVHRGRQLWLDPEMTSPYAWYQYFVNVADADVGRYLRMFTFLPPRGDRGAGEGRRRAAAPARPAQRALAEELTTLVHGARQTAQVVAASQALFGRGDLRELDARPLDAALAEVPHGTGGPAERPTSSTCWSPPAWRRAAEPRGARSTEGGAYVNNVKVDRRRLGAGGGRPAARALAGGAPGQAQPRRRPGRRRPAISRSADLRTRREATPGGAPVTAACNVLPRRQGGQHDRPGRFAGP